MAHDFTAEQFYECVQIQNGCDASRSAATTDADAAEETRIDRMLNIVWAVTDFEKFAAEIDFAANN